MKIPRTAAPACWSWPIPDTHDGTLAALIAWHDGRCAVCGDHFPGGKLAPLHTKLVRDHDHKTGLMRGYLCRSCNVTEPNRTDGTFAMYRERHPASLLDIRVRYSFRTGTHRAGIGAAAPVELVMVGKSRLGHYKQPGYHLTYCGRTATPATREPNRMCQHCVKGEALDRAEAAAVAESYREDLTAAEDVAQTWQTDWVSATSDAPTLFDLAGPSEQGTLF